MDDRFVARFISVDSRSLAVRELVGVVRNR
jgi:hypothetical protein